MWVVGSKYLTGNKAIYVCIMYNFMCTFCAINEKAKYLLGLVVKYRSILYTENLNFTKKKLFCILFMN